MSTQQKINADAAIGLCVEYGRHIETLRNQRDALVEALHEVFDCDAGHPSRDTAVKMRAIAADALSKVEAAK